jgi:hypothetical protein
VALATLIFFVFTGTANLNFSCMKNTLICALFSAILFISGQKDDDLSAVTDTGVLIDGKP